MSNDSHVELPRGLANELIALYDGIVKIVNIYDEEDRKRASEKRMCQRFGERFFNKKDREEWPDLRDTLTRIASSNNDLKGVRQEVSGVPGEESEELTRQLVENEDKATETEFSDFLLNVGSSVVKAQKQLDRESEMYLKDASQKDHIVKSVFRIPRVTANIKFGMKRVKGNGFNIILAKKKNEEESSLDQGLDFEVVAVPPPPEIMARVLTQQLPDLHFELSPGMREEVFDILEAFNEDGKIENSLKSKLKIDLLIKNKDKVLMINVSANNKWIFWILYANEEGDNNVGIWYLEQAPDEPPIFHSLIGFSADPRFKSTGESYKDLRDLVLKMTNDQVKIFEETK